MAMRVENAASQFRYNVARISSSVSGLERKVACRISHPGRVQKKFSLPAILGSDLSGKHGILQKNWMSAVSNAFTRSEHLGKRLGCQNKVPKQSPTLKCRRISCSTNQATSTNPSGSPLLSELILDRVSGFLLKRGKKLFPEAFSASNRTLNWLPSELHEQIHKSEAFATMMVREGLIFGTLGLLYFQVDGFCRGLYKIVSATKHGLLITDGADYQHSVFHAATDPLRLSITIWASTHLMRVTAVSAQLHQYIPADFYRQARGIGVVVASTWFLFRSKQHISDKYVLKHKTEEPRILAFDRLVSLLLYFLAATYIANIVGFALKSLLAVGGVSGLAVGLASKEIASNIFGGVVIFLTRPFVIGEEIKAGSVSGRVVDIGYMQTKVLGFDGTPLLVPNQAFTNQVITNFSRANSKQMEASFHVHNEDIFLVNKITKDVLEYLKTHPQVDTTRPPPECYLNTMGLHGPEISVLCSIDLEKGSFFEVRQEIMVQVARIVSDVLEEESPYFRSSVKNLMREKRMHSLYAGQDVQPGNS